MQYNKCLREPTEHTFCFLRIKGRFTRLFASDFETQRQAELGEYIPARLVLMREKVPYTWQRPLDYSGWMLYGFENGKIAKVDLSLMKQKANAKN
jgi:DNA gyrase subunit A